MTLRRRLGVLAIAMSALLVAGLLLSAPAFASVPTAMIDANLKAACQPDSDQALVTGTVSLSDEQVPGKVLVEYATADTVEFTRATEESFVAHQTKLDFHFNVPAPDSDTATITVHVKASFEGNDQTAEDVETRSFDNCAPEETPPPPGGELKPCSAADGLASHSDISVDLSSAHPSASAQFTVKDGCQVVVFLASGKITGDGIEDVDFAPSDGPPLFGPGEHSLEVRLPDCAKFIVDFVALSPDPETEGQQALMSKAKSDAVQTMSEEAPADDALLDEVTGKTTNCPTEASNPPEASNPKVVPSTTVVEVAAPAAQAQGELPDTGSNALPILIAGLVLVAGGACAVVASRLRSRQVK